MKLPAAVLGLAVLAGLGCAAPAAPPAFDRLDRASFNAVAAELDLPLFWRVDANANRSVDPDELAYLWGVSPASAASEWIAGGAFTPAFREAYDKMVAARTAGPARVQDPAEGRRRELVRKELAQGRPTLLESDFRNASPQDRAIVEHVLKAAVVVERIHAAQNGVLGFETQIPADDPASRMLFYRNQGPFCAAPKTEKDPDCNAVPARPKKTSGLYPASIQADPGFCDALEKSPERATLLAPFVVVREGEGGALRPVPYNVEYAADMAQVAEELDAAAAAITSGDEAPFQAYLRQAAQAFRDNNWQPADEAWSKMSATNSKWYLRIGPDEVYFEPCAEKAGFHVSFARINQDSLLWQEKLDPLKNEMEATLAAMAGPPYAARSVSFHLPDFIDIILNAGDSRDPTGGTIGQSLPNWGPVANEGRGRTVAMTNLNTDEDSKTAYLEQMSSLVCQDSMANVSFDPKLINMSTVLHEAAHNLGPAHEYTVNGKVDGDLFGGPLASMLEELKAQTSALYLTDWLAGRGIIDAQTAARAHVRDIGWAMGHIAQGMVGGDGRPKPYSQLAAIQLGSFVEGGALTWNEGATAANGKDRGCFSVHPEKLQGLIESLEKRVLRIKAAGDRADALALKAAYVDDSGAWSKLRGVIQERWLRAPRASFVYAVR